MEEIFWAVMQGCIPLFLPILSLRVIFDYMRMILFDK